MASKLWDIAVILLLLILVVFLFCVLACLVGWAIVAVANIIDAWSNR